MILQKPPGTSYQTLFWPFTAWTHCLKWSSLQILGLQPRISNFFSIRRTFFFSQWVRTILVTKNRGSGNRVSDFCVSGGPPCMLVHGCYVRNTIDLGLALLVIFIQRTGSYYKNITPSTLIKSFHVWMQVDFCNVVLTSAYMYWIEGNFNSASQYAKINSTKTTTYCTWYNFIVSQHLKKTIMNYHSFYLLLMSCVYFAESKNNFNLRCWVSQKS